MAALFRGGSVKKKASTESESPRKIVEGDIPGQIFFGGSSAAWTQSFKLKNPPAATSVPSSKVDSHGVLSAACVCMMVRC